MSICFIRHCFKLDNCITFANIDVPKIFSLESKPLIARFSIKIGDECIKIKDNFKFRWNKESFGFKKAIINSEDFSYTIKFEDLKQGKFEILGDIFYKENHLKKMYATTTLVLYKVIKKEF